MYGHQSSDNGPLTIQAKLNDKMDILAKRIGMEYVESNSLLQSDSDSLGISIISCNGKIITSRVQHYLYDTILHDQLIGWYAAKKNTPLEILQNNIAWRAIKGARKEGKLSITNFMTKWVSGDTARGRVMLRRNERYLQTAQDAMLRMNT